MHVNLNMIFGVLVHSYTKRNPTFLGPEVALSYAMRLLGSCLTGSVRYCQKSVRMLLESTKFHCKKVTVRGLCRLFQSYAMRNVGHKEKT